jgi:hypothetical protein
LPKVLDITDKQKLAYTAAIRFCNRSFCPSISTDDLVQNFFVKRGHVEYTNPSHFFNAVTQTCIDYLRYETGWRRKNHVKFVNNFEWWAIKECKKVSISRFWAIEEVDAKDFLETLLSRLIPMDRTIVLMRINGDTLLDIGKQIGRTKTQVCNRLNRNIYPEVRKLWKGL